MNIQEEKSKFIVCDKKHVNEVVYSILSEYYQIPICMVETALFLLLSHTAIWSLLRLASSSRMIVTILSMIFYRLVSTNSSSTMDFA